MQKKSYLLTALAVSVLAVTAFAFITADAGDSAADDATISVEIDGGDQVTCRTLAEAIEKINASTSEAILWIDGTVECGSDTLNVHKSFTVMSGNIERANFAILEDVGITFSKGTVYTGKITRNGVSFNMCSMRAGDNGVTIGHGQYNASLKGDICSDAPGTTVSISNGNELPFDINGTLDRSASILVKQNTMIVVGNYGGFANKGFLKLENNVVLDISGTFTNNGCIEIGENTKEPQVESINNKNGLIVDLRDENTTSYGVIPLNGNEGDWGRVACSNDTRKGAYAAEYSGIKTVELLDTEKISVSCSSENLTYDGSAKTATITINADGKNITSDDYIVYYFNNINAGDAKYVIMSVGDNYGFSTVEGTFKIGKATPELEDFNSPAYDKTEKAVVISTVPGVEGMGKVTVTYYKESGGALSGAPVEPGTYNFTFSVAEGKNYAGKDFSDPGWKFTIEKPKTEGTIPTDKTEYKFDTEIKTTGDLNIDCKVGTEEYVITIPKNTTIAADTKITINRTDDKSEESYSSYEITTGGIKNFNVKLPCKSGFVSATVLCNDSAVGVSNVVYNSAEGYVTFTADHNSEFSITLSSAAPTPAPAPSTDSDTYVRVASQTEEYDYSLIIAFGALILSIGFLAAVLRR